MRARTGNRVLFGILGVMILGLAVVSLSGDEEARSALRRMVVLALAIGGLSYLSYRFKVGPRRAAFSGQAMRLGLRAVKGDPTGFLGSGFEVVRRRASFREVETTAVGRWRGHDVVVVDYWYAPTSNPQWDDYVRFVCATFPVPRGWPRLLVIPERIATLVGDALLAHEPDTELDAFNRRYAVRTDDRRFATAMLDARMIDWMMRFPTHTGFEILDGRLLCFVARQASGDVEHVLRTGDEFLARVPTTVTAWYG